MHDNILDIKIKLQNYFFSKQTYFNIRFRKCFKYDILWVHLCKDSNYFICTYLIAIVLNNFPVDCKKSVLSIINKIVVIAL